MRFHRKLSVLTKFNASSGDLLVNAGKLALVNDSFTLGCWIALIIAANNISIIGLGVLAGANMAFQLSLPIPG